MPMDDRDDTPHWLTRPSTILRLWWIFGVVLAIVTLAGLTGVIHPHFGIDGTFGFYSWYGFTSCIAMVLVAKVLGVMLKRRDDYYECD